MEHSCQQCGSAVEDGRPFCPQCRAPQIHVQIAAPDSEIAAGLNSAQGTLSSETSQIGYSAFPTATAGSTLNRTPAVRAALQAGVVGILLGIIPFLGILLTGALAVYFYRRQSGYALPAALASRLGGAAGVITFAINALLITIEIFVFHARQRYTDYVMTIVQRFGANASDPDMQASIHNMFTPGGLALTFFFVMIVSVVLASIGGAVASLVMRAGNPRA